jgi:hypothetical protein
LKAGTEPVPAAAAPDGWVAVSLPGPFDAYVQDADFTKDLNVRPGTPLHVRPSAESGVIAVAAKGDKIEITGLEGKWNRVRLDQPLVGYVQVSAPPPAAATAPAEPAPNNAPGHPAPSADQNAAAPRTFEGRFASTRRPFLPRRPYDWDLEASDGSRIAYLDVSRLLQTEQIDKYVGHDVLVFGSLHPVPGAKDLVIAVDSLRLK